MYIDIVPNRASPPAVLLRESVRERGKVVKRTLANLGHSRDGKRGTLQVNFGLMTDARGCPVAVSVYPGNTADSKTLVPQLTRLREEFGLEDVVLVGDRGMISQKQIDAMTPLEGVAWITALRTERIKQLVDVGAADPPSA